MVQTAQSRMADHRTGRRGTDSAARGFLAEAKMGAVLVMVGDVFGKEPLPVPLIESNDMVEQLAATTPHPNARRLHSARDFRTRSARRLSSGIESLPGPPSRILHPGHG
jgi:hypothetical protein